MAHIVVVPDIVPGGFGVVVVGFTVRDEFALLPQALVAVTITVPAVEPGFTIMVVVP